MACDAHVVAETSTDLNEAILEKVASGSANNDRFESGYHPLFMHHRYSPPDVFISNFPIAHLITGNLVWRNGDTRRRISARTRNRSHSSSARYMAAIGGELDRYQSFEKVATPDDFGTSSKSMVRKRRASSNCSHPA